MRLYGNESGIMGDFEWAKTLHWNVLIAAVILAVCGWFLGDVIPALSGLGGVYSIAAFALTPFVQALIQKYSNNSGKSLK